MNLHEAQIARYATPVLREIITELLEAAGKYSSQHDEMLKKTSRMPLYRSVKHGVVLKLPSALTTL